MIFIRPSLSESVLKSWTKIWETRVWIPTYAKEARWPWDSHTVLEEFTSQGNSEVKKEEENDVNVIDFPLGRKVGWSTKNKHIKFKNSYLEEEENLDLYLAFHMKPQMGL